MPLLLRFYRGQAQLPLYGARERPDLPEGCSERLNGETLTFWRWIRDTGHSARLQVQRLAESGEAGGRLVHLKSRGEVRRWLAGPGAK